jgi:hypothetical protein
VKIEIFTYTFFVKSELLHIQFYLKSFFFSKKKKKNWKPQPLCTCMGHLYKHPLVPSSPFGHPLASETLVREIVGWIERRWILGILPLEEVTRLNLVLVVVISLLA